MAISTVYSAKFTAFILIVLCTETHIFASEDDIYNIEAIQSISKFQDISVIKYENRRRRQTSGSSNGSTMATTQSPTTTPDLAEMNIIHDDHQYYESQTFKPANMNDFWIELQDVTGHSTLSDSHRTAVTAKLPFRFPFYGHLIDNVTIATGGFLYMSPFLHQWLTATQYIAPLMANFDTRIGNTSEIYYSSMDKKFVVEWRDVHLQDQNGRSTEDTGSFRFQAILHINGSITFVYKQIPIPISNISTKSHKVTVGMSDAFYFDAVKDGTKRRTIYEYHRVVLNTTFIEEGTIVLMNPQPTCNRYSDCETCVSANINFECKWCGIIKKCSDSVDWHRQEWLNAGCVHLSGSANCSSIPTAKPPVARTATNGVGTQIGVIVVVVVIFVVLIGAIGGWIYYAYTHPTSASGMWLMEHRPSQMKAKMSNMKFWKRNGTAGDKYAVESTA